MSRAWLNCRQPGRPRIVNAIGVISVILGIMGALGNVVLGLDAISWYQAALIPPTMTTTTVFHYIEPETTVTAPGMPAALTRSF
jgi:hypothetical protein